MYFDDLRTWYATVQPIYDFQFEMVGLPDIQAQATVYAKRQKDLKAAKTAAGAPPAAPETAVAANSAQVSQAELLSGPGWVVEIRGYHFHNSVDSLDKFEAVEAYVIKSILKNMITQKVTLDSEEFAFSDFGVFYPTLIQFSEKSRSTLVLPDVTSAESDDAGAAGEGANASNAPPANAAPTNAPPANATAAAGQAQPPGNTAPAPSRKTESVEKSTFVVQFAWIPRSKQERILARELRLKSEADPSATADENAKAGATNPANAAKPADNSAPPAAPATTPQPAPQDATPPAAPNNTTPPAKTS